MAEPNIPKIEASKNPAGGHYPGCAVHAGPPGRYACTCARRPNIPKIEADAIFYAIMSCLPAVTQAYRYFHAQGKTERDFDRCAHEAMTKAVRNAVQLTEREVKDPVWPYALEGVASAAPLDWAPLAEIPEERAIFDGDARLVGDVRLAIAVALRSSAHARPGGSYAAQMRIMANEVMKLRLPAAGVLAAEQLPNLHAKSNSTD